jgi:hypothetical protein
MVPKSRLITSDLAHLLSKPARRSDRPGHLPSNPTRRSGQLGPRRATMLGRVADQLPTKQPFEAESQSSAIGPRQQRQGVSSPSNIRTYVQHIEWTSGGHHQHDCTPPRKVSSVSPLPYGSVNLSRGRTLAPESQQ